MSQFVNPLPGVPDVESPLFEPIFREKNTSQQTRDLAQALRRDGYVVLDFPDPDFGQLADTIIKKLDSRYDWAAWRKGSLDSLRVQDAWQDVPEVRRIACNQTILQILTDLYGRRAFPFQTLNFPVGTQQHFHTDSIHFSSCPERFMVGVWVALEDIDSDNGPLIYYPGSHKLPIYTNEQVGRNPNFAGKDPSGHYGAFGEAWRGIVEALDLKPMEFHAKKGQALIWSANLLHGGAAQKDLQRTRYSQVTQSSISPGPVGSHPSVLRVHSLEAGISCVAACPKNGPKCSPAFSAGIETTGTFSPLPIVSAISRSDTPSSCTA
jgi:hypothetical protein